MTTVSLTISEALDIALKSYYAGKLADAEQVCLKILSADPDSAATLNLLAVIHTSLGRNDAALACYDRALTLRPDFTLGSGFGSAVAFSGAGSGNTITANTTAYILGGANLPVAAGNSPI